MNFEESNKCRDRDGIFSMTIIVTSCEQNAKSLVLLHLSNISTKLGHHIDIHTHVPSIVTINAIMVGPTSENDLPQKLQKKGKQG